MRVTADMRAAVRWMIVGELWSLAIEILVLLALVWAGYYAGPAFFGLALAFAVPRGAYRTGTAAAYIWRLVWPRPPAAPRQHERCLWPPRRHDVR